MNLLPPAGEVRVATSQSMPLNTIRLLVVSKLGQIRSQPRKLQTFPNPSPKRSADGRMTDPGWSVTEAAGYAAYAPSHAKRISTIPIELFGTNIIIGTDSASDSAAP